jgi:hypothetical protein
MKLPFLWFISAATSVTEKGETGFPSSSCVSLMNSEISRPENWTARLDRPDRPLSVLSGGPVLAHTRDPYTPLSWQGQKAFEENIE